jgi:hypothetical protein
MRGGGEADSVRVRVLRVLRGGFVSDGEGAAEMRRAKGTRTIFKTSFLMRTVVLLLPAVLCALLQQRPQRRERAVHKLPPVILLAAV